MPENLFWIKMKTHKSEIAILTDISSHFIFWKFFPKKGDLQSQLSVPEEEVRRKERA